ncbi:hypothetical protein QVA66_09200 [Staphylococcus chromogenes]|nr:hypothetical protein [Staphylococcus chromogenes]
MTSWKMRLVLMFEPWFLPLQLVCIVYSAMYGDEDMFSRFMAMFWYFMLPLLAGTQTVKYATLNQPRSIWRRDFMIANSVFFAIMAAVGLWRNPDRIMLLLGIYCIGWACSYLLHRKSYGQSKKWVIGGADSRRPTTPAWCHSVLVPMLTPWLIVIAILLALTCFIATRGIPANELAPFVGGASVTGFVGPLATQASFRGWTALNRPRSQWIKLSWLSDFLVVALLGVAGALIAALFPGEVTCLQAVTIVACSGMILAAVGNTSLFLAKMWLVSAVVGALSGGVILFAVMFSMFWEQRLVALLMATTAIAISLFFEVVLRPWVVRKFDINRSPFQAEK